MNSAPARSFVYSGLLAWIFLFSRILTPITYAEIGQCGASVSPSFLTPASQQTFTFTVENNGPDDAVWVRISSQTGSLTIPTGSADGWSVSNTGSEITFSGGNIEAGQEENFSVEVTSGSEEMSAQTWTVKTNSEETASGATTCGGSPSIAITGEAPPTLDITSVTISNVTSTTATIAFTTGISATSSLEYGTSDEYDSSDEISSATTSHSYNLTGLTADTVYHFKVAANADDNSVETDDETFNTAAVGAGTTTTVTVTTETTTTSTVTRTITPTPTPDRKAPVVTLETVAKTPTKTAPTIIGSAVDNDQVNSIEYTLDNGKTWIRVSNATGLTTNVADFRFSPATSADGTSKVKVRAKDAAANVGTSAEVSFILDQNGPLVSLSTSISSPFKVSPTVRGTATDASGESSIEYSLDGGKNWQAVDEVSTSSTTQTNFVFTPPPLDDGNYDLYIRGTDSLGNTGEESKHTLIIDRLPPRIGATMMFIGPQELSHRADGTISTISNISHTISISIIGGPTEVVARLVSPTSTKEIPLTRQVTTNLWQATFRLESPDTYDLIVFARDGAGNTDEKKVAVVVGHTPGQISSTKAIAIASTATVYVQDKTTNEYVIWDASPYSQQNPQRTTAEDRLGYLLPPGTYYMEVKAPGYETLQTTIFTLTHTTAISPTFTLKSLPSITLLGRTFSLPHFQRTYMSYTPESQEEALNTTLPFGFPSTTLETNERSLSSTDLLGKKTLVTVMNTYSPQSLSQLAQLDLYLASHPDAHVVVVVPNQSASTTTLFAKRGRYTVPIFADPDGTLLDSLPYNTTPSHFVFNNQGEGIAIQTGLQSIQSLENLMAITQ